MSVTLPTNPVSSVADTVTAAILAVSDCNTRINTTDNYLETAKTSELAYQATLLHLRNVQLQNPSVANLAALQAHEGTGAT